MDRYRDELIASINNEIELFLKNKSLELKNLEIFDCNAHFAGPFTSAEFRMPYLGISSSLPSDPPAPWSSYTYTFDEVFDRRILEEMLNMDNNSRNISTELNEAHKTLLQYIADIDRHQWCLKKVIDSSADKHDIAYALAVHLFRPLCHSCVIDEHTTVWPESCPCGCNKTMQKGSTGIGDTKTWHGHSDIVINQTVPVKIFVNDTNVKSDDMEPEQDDQNPELSNDSNCSSNLQIKFHNMKQPICEVIAQTITNAFAQVNRNPDMKNFLVPSFGCSGETVMIFAYDSTTDTLMKTTENIKLWTHTSSTSLSLSSLVHIWMYINFAHCMMSSLSQKYETKRSNFHQVPNIDYFRKDSKCCLKGFSKREIIDSDYSLILRPRKKPKFID